MIRVLLVDDHTMVRKGIRMLLQSHHDVEVIGESQDGNEAIAQAMTLRPDVILMDLSMPGGLDGFQASKEIIKNDPAIKIIILTMFDEEIYVHQAIQSGVQGYILKNSQGEILIEAIRTVYQGNIFYKTSVSEGKLKEWLSKNDKDFISVITEREEEILRLVVLGYSNKEIADKLIISVKTVENHKRNIMDKLGFESRHELVQFAIKNKYLDLAY